MSEYWSPTSGTALVFPKEEVRDFFTRYLLDTYRKDGVTDRDIDFIDCTISEYGSDSFYFLRSAYRQSLLEDFHSLESCVNERAAAEHKKELFNSTRPQDLLGDDGYKSTEEIIKEFKEKLAAYVPDDFDWESHIGFFQCASFA